ncbi:MAG: translation initiation factor IF-2 [Candidatus Yanofskybacteria bacterium]|nr:translation initiation factor IF-2 [Candidatus Yanofskybacteria bacterium]
MPVANDLRQTSSSTLTRPPVVVVLGHVDHGKTLLLDTIRKSNIAAKETGGITQHIGAYQTVINDKLITFLDTPGHEAFTAIRSRGTKVADIAILVVAADESVKPQTKEAIQIIKQAEIPVIVAINKIDKEGANPAKVKQDLAAEEILVEDWGGTVPVVEVSAKEGKNIKELLEMVLLVAELQELKRDVTLPTQGVIIESNLDKRRGYVATALIQKGILSIGDWIVVGTVIGKVKSMEDFLGQAIEEAYPSQPVRIIGWSQTPNIGKTFTSAQSKNEAEELVSKNVDLKPLLLFLRDSSPEPTGTKKILNIVFKSDVSSSLEALDSALQTMGSEEVGCHVLDYSIGNITEADVKTASNTRALILGFRVGVEESARKLAEKEGVTIASYDIIYELIERVRTEMGALLAPEIKRNVFGKLKVLAVFKTESRSQIVGGKVTSGKAVRGAMIDIVRGNTLIQVGRLGQLQQKKEDVPEVKEGLEAGFRVDRGDSTEDIKEGDILEIYEEEHVQRSL